MLLSSSSVFNNNMRMVAVRRNGIDQEPPSSIEADRIYSPINHLIDLFKEDAEDYSKGKVVEVSGKLYLVIALFHLQIADIPGAKFMLCMSEGNNNTTGGCRCCFCSYKDYGESEFRPELRLERTEENIIQLQTLMRSEDDNIDIHTLMETFLQPWGVVNYSHLFDLPGFFSYKQSPYELMHVVMINEIKAALKHTCEALCKNEEEKTHFMRGLSVQFKAHVLKNRIQCAYNFKSIKSLVNALHAHGCRVFLDAAPYLLLHSLQFKINDPRHKMILLLWTSLRTAGRYLAQHKLTPASLMKACKAVREYIGILEYTFGDCRLNTHGLTHIYEDCYFVGAPRGLWAMAFESKHCPIKKELRRTNNRSEAKSCFERYNFKAYLQVVASCDTGNLLQLNVTRNLKEITRKNREPHRYDFIPLRHHSNYFNKVWTEINVIEEYFDMEEDVVIDFQNIDHFTYHPGSKGAKSAATICYNTIRIGDYVALKFTPFVVQIQLFLRAEFYSDGNSYPCIGYYLPQSHYEVECRHEVLEWEQVDLRMDVSKLFIVPTIAIETSALHLLQISGIICITLFYYYYIIYATNYSIMLSRYSGFGVQKRRAELGGRSVKTYT
jgi:hypothetical protein